MKSDVSIMAYLQAAQMLGEATMEASEDQKASKNRASPPASNGHLAVANWSPSPAANSEQDAKLTASSTEISTESDSEKDAAEAYNGAGSDPASHCPLAPRAYMPLTRCLRDPTRLHNPIRIQR